MGDVPRIRLVGSSDVMRGVQRQALLAARLNSNVLVTGERGAGKGAVAQFIHEHSDRSIHGFGMIKCDGLPDVLFQSALFGQVKGRFAGAYRDKPGLVESVAGGTIFLNEVSGLSARLQARLLWFLETGEYLPNGSTLVQTQDPLQVRFLASTAVDLETRVVTGDFLGDLYRRLNVIRLSVSPLRDRREDIPSLVNHFAGRFAVQRDVSNVVRDALRRPEWPGNVCDLKSFVFRRLLSAGGARTLSWRARKPESVNS